MNQESSIDVTIKEEEEADYDEGTQNVESPYRKLSTLELKSNHNEQATDKG